MSYFLWIEDFENSPKVTASEVLGGIVEAQSLSDHKQQLKNNLKQQGVFVELSFQDGLGFIRNHLQKIDYIILDIDLPAYSKGDEINDEVLQLLEQYYGHDRANNDESLLGGQCKALKEVAGYHIYTELVVQLGFPKEHILFCSNHGENLKSIQDAFKIAKITLPTIYQKSNPDVQTWVVEKHQNPYSRLRRGIIEGCQYLIDLPDNQFRFNQFIPNTDKRIAFDDIHNYLDILTSFFPLQVPDNLNQSRSYKHFIRILTHEWDVAKPKQLDKLQELLAFSTIMKMARNWSAHGNVFEAANSQDVAFMFIANARTMFDLGQDLLPYERHLLKLFKPVIEPNVFEELVGDCPNNRKIPLIEYYALLLKKHGNTYQAINFHEGLNDLQHGNKANSAYLIRGLYQVYWFLTSYGHVYIPPYEEKLKQFNKLNYQFGYFNYKKHNYLFEIARHIYKSSFPKA